MKINFGTNGKVNLKDVNGHVYFGVQGQSIAPLINNIYLANGGLDLNASITNNDTESADI